MLNFTKTPGGPAYAAVIVGAVLGMTHIKLDVSTLTAAEIDANGYSKPGIPLQKDGTLVSGAGQSVYGITIEASKFRVDNTGLAADVTDPIIAVCTSGLVNLDIVEDNLGRALSANELAAFTGGGCRLQLTTT